MGYHVTTLRTRQGRPSPIAREEVEATVGARPALQASPGEGRTLEVTVKALGEESPLLVWQDGELWAKNPEAETLRLMLDLAGSLGARVRGDELETYRTPTETYVHPDDAALVRQANADVRKMIARARIKSFIPLAIFLAVVMLYGYCSRAGR